MATQNTIPADIKSEAKEAEGQVTQAAGNLVLASIGGVALAQDAALDLYHRMIERGEESQRAAQKRMDKLRAKRPSFSRTGVRNLTDSVRDAAELPSKADIQGLHDQIAALSAKVDQLSKEKYEPSIPTLPKPSTKP
jgi:polyhydroxyalkanoate synthesis regulator phasin